MKQHIYQSTLLLLVGLIFSNPVCHGLFFARATPRLIVATPRGGATNNSSSSSPADKKPKKKRKSHKSSSSSTPNKSVSPIVEDIMKEDDYYRVLGISKDELKQSKNVDRDIQKAYRKRAVHTHPDKTGGDRRAFDKVAEAYEVLQDKDKRASYDRFGKEGMKQQQQFGGGGAGINAEDLFRSFFGGGFGNSGFPGNAQSQRARQYILEVSLEDLYSGATKNVQLPGGETVECEIPRGMREGTALSAETLTGESVLFIVRPRQHHLFTKQGANLILTIRISLTESITGVQRKITHLDGSSIHIVSAGDGLLPSIIESGDVQVLKGCGMPQEGTMECGDLYIQYEVVTKRQRGSLSESEMTQLKTLLAKLEGRKSASKSNWPFKEHKKAMKLGVASGDDLNARSDPFGSSGFSFGSGFSPFGGGGTFFSASGGYR